MCGGIIGTDKWEKSFDRSQISWQDYTSHLAWDSPGAVGKEHVWDSLLLLQLKTDKRENMFECYKSLGNLSLSLIFSHKFLVGGVCSCKPSEIRPTILPPDYFMRTHKM